VKEREGEGKKEREKMEEEKIKETKMGETESTRGWFLREPCFPN
jgi:hypothetical protein